MMTNGISEEGQEGSMEDENPSDFIFSDIMTASKKSCEVRAFKIWKFWQFKNLQLHTDTNTDTDLFHTINFLTYSSSHNVALQLMWSTLFH